MKNKKGYTLVEVVISMLLIMVVMIYLLRTIIVLINKNTDLLTYQEFSVYEDNLLNDIYGDIKLAYEADKLMENAVEGTGNEITFKDINKKLVINEEDNTITYNDTIYALPDNVTFRKVDDKLYHIKGVLQSTHDYYIVTVHLKVNKNDEEMKILYQNKNDSDLRIAYDLNSTDTINPPKYDDPDYEGVQHVKYGLNVLQPPRVSRRGYDFSKNKSSTGWYTEPFDDNASVESSKEAKREMFIKGPTTYYAHWSIHNYVISYTGANASVSGNPTSFNVKTDTFTLKNPTRTGYTFKGWSGTELTGDTNKSVTVTKNSISDRTYTANWTAHTYTIKYNGNGNTGGSMSNSSHTYDTAKNLTSNGFTKTGYTFAGWATSASGAVAYGNGASVKNLTATNGATVNLYAKWTANKYTLTFNANGGSVSPGSKQVTYDSTYGSLPTPSRGGYIFVGWYTSGTFDSTYYSNTYADLKNAFGTSWQGLIGHWVNNGMKEGRRGSANNKLASDTYKTTGNQTLIAGWTRHGQDSSCGCSSYNTCEACGCASYDSCPNAAACGTSTTYIPHYSLLSPSSCSDQVSCTNCPPYSGGDGGCGKSGQVCCRSYTTRTTAKSCPNSSCSCNTYNSCSSCSCATYKTCYY